MSATEVMDAAWAVLYDRAAQADVLLAQAGKEPQEVERLTAAVWPEDWDEDEFEGDETAAIVELSAWVNRMNREMI